MDEVNNWMNSAEVMRGPFCAELHKRTFINYLEVVIREDGTIEYATPSHQEKTIAVACEKLGVTRKELEDLCPQEYYFDFMNWLCMVSGCVSIWNEHMMGIPNEAQRQAIQGLIDEKLYHGRISG